MSDAADRQHDAPHGTARLPSDLTDEQLAAAPVLASVDALLIEELSEDEDEASPLRSIRESLSIQACAARRSAVAVGLGSRRRIGLMAGHEMFLAAVTVSELRYGALVAGWGEARRNRLEKSIQATTVVPVSNRFLSTLAELRFACRGGSPTS